MLKVPPKYQQLNNGNSYFYQQQRKKRRSRWFKFFLFILLLLLTALTIVVSVVQAKTLEPLNDVINNSTPKMLNNNTKNPFINGPQLLFNHPDPSMRAALPVDMQASININGLVVYTEIKQVFINPHAIALEGKYQFPLPENAAVNYLKVRIGDRIIEGKIMEKQAAKKAYIKAKISGRKASLVEQQRANLFTNKIANIPPQTTVEVTIRLISSVSYHDGNFSLSLPLAMTARYQPTNYQHSPAEQNSEFFSPAKKSLASSEAAITINLNAGVALKDIVSNNHAINSQALNQQGSHYKISLAKQQVLADQQFTLQWQLNSTNAPQVSSFSEQIDDNYYTLLTFYPPQQAPSFTQTSPRTLPRDVIFIIDTSGSMQGRSIEQAKASLLKALSLLTAQDSFNIIAFSSSSQQLFKHSEMLNKQTSNKAQYFIEHLYADGGTEMYRPLNNALAMAKSADQSSSAIRQLVFITDGAVANEFELMKLLKTRLGKARLFTIGIGAAPNGYFMKKAAQFGRGSYVFIQNLTEVQNKVSALIKKISQPVLSNITLMLDQKINQALAPDIEIYPKNIPDLYVGETLQVAIKSPLPINSLELHGLSAKNTWQQQLLVNDQQSARGISTLWARRKIADLLDGLVISKNPEDVKQQVLATSISHQIISPYSSFIALEKQPTNSKPLLASTSLLKNSLTKNKTSSHAFKIAIPQTALGWQQQFLLGLLLLMVASVMLWQQTKSSTSD
jgi:Ca-activated chloride channel family protein